MKMREHREMRARCDEKHLIALREIALYEGIKQAEALRLLVREKARELGVWPEHQRQAQERERRQ
jgi:hypothetical protein